MAEKKDSGEDFSERIRHPDLLRLYEYWLSRRQGNRLPSRQDLDPAGFRFVLGHVMLIDVLQEPLRFQFRLFGSLLAERMGKDLTGMPVDAMADPAFRDALVATYRKIVEIKRPSAALYERQVGRKSYRYQVLRLPLASDGETVDMLLLCPLYLDEPPAFSPVAGPLLSSSGQPRLLSEVWGD